MKTFKSNLLKLSQATHGGRKDLLANPELVKLVAKDQLRKTLYHTGWNAMYNSKIHLRRAALTGRYYDLPEWVRYRIHNLYFRIINVSRPSGLRLP